ncbi:MULTISPECIES: energy transducer TonB [unclassified Duganella]|uniref:energy transducer TonB family protein n=1 Tax=unclassified Duganella TaxID=2636909 RepID=UPI0006FF4150|nr:MULTISPECIES: energy transducer TonB [unclassified Duganella]KQV54360.1 hypothetical protein ASD07_07485 [Duganella sp. Root336D2]
MRRAPWGKAGALALTVLVHLALLLGVRQHGSAPKALPQPAPVVLTVALLPEPAAAPAEPATLPEPVLPPPAALSPAPHSTPEPPAVPEQSETPPQFFQLHELTTPPAVADGLTRGELLELPGTKGGYITVRFWINALGEVVRAKIVGVDGNEDDEEKLLAALRQVRFLPARIGHAAVPSELEMELRVVRAAGL